jgi:ribosomal protein S7
MARRTVAPVREILPDAVYNSVVLEKFIRRMMLDGKKSISTKITYDALKIIGEKGQGEPLEVFLKAVENVKPVVEVKSRRVGGATYQVPVEVKESRREACVCDFVQRYDIRGKTILFYQEKAYVCDLGFFKLRKNRVKDEFNYIIESLCYNELIARGYTVYIGKTHRGEVDFIAEKQETRKYFQVAYLLESEQTIEREFNGFLGIDDSYPKYLISMDKLKLSRDGIVHIPLIDWLLSPED